MNLLLDTQALLWWRQGNARRLGPRARAAIERGATAVRVSAVTAWELAIKSRTGRLELREPLHRWFRTAIDESGFVALSITVDHAVAVAGLPDHHGDPFDRLLIAQARLEKLTILTADAVFDDYDVDVLDARE